MPDFKTEVRLRLSRLGLEPTREAAIVEELAQHLEQRFEDLLAQGMSTASAREAVLKELSEGSRLERDLLRVERQVRFEPAPPATPTLGSSLTALRKDLRHALRSLRLNPGFATIAVLSLALGIGANTAIFQLLDAVTLRSLPVKDPDRLMIIRTPNATGRTGSARGNAPFFSYPIWEQVRAQQQAFSGLAAWNSVGFNMAERGRARGARGLYVNGDFFNALGIRPLLGRVFTAADDQRGCGLPGAVISYGYWQKEFGGKNAVGSKLMVEGHPVEVIGVTPPGFYGLEVGRSYDVAVPLCSEVLIAGESSILERRDGWWLAIIGRLKPGWSAAKATAQLEAISPGIFQATLPAGYRPDQAKKFVAWKMAAEPAGTGISGLRRAYEYPLCILLAIAGAVLLIACANLANLMFARANAREREIAVRARAGCLAHSSSTAAVDGKPCALRDWRGLRNFAGAGTHAHPDFISCHTIWQCQPGSWIGLAGTWLYRRCGGDHVPVLWIDAGDQVNRDSSHCRHEGWHPRSYRWARALWRASNPGSGTSRYVNGIAGGRIPFCPQFPESCAPQCRFSANRHSCDRFGFYSTQYPCE
jgi:hypothetical protein